MMIIILQRLQCHSARKRCCFRLFYVYWRHGKGQSRRRVLTTTIVSFKTKQISDVPTALEATVQCHSGGCRKQTSSLSLLLSHSPELSLTAFAATPGSPNLCTTCHLKKFHFWSGNMDQTTLFGLVTLKWIRVKVVWKSRENRRRILPSSKKKKKKTPNQYTYAYGGCGAVMATLLGRAAFPLTWTRYWHMALFIFFASLVLPASTSGWFITFSVDIHTPFPEWGGASTSRVILISNNGVEGWAAFPGTRWTKKKGALDVSLLPNDYYKRDTSRYSFSRGCGRRNVEGRSPRFIAPKVPAEFLSLPFRALICLNTLALIQSASSTCAGFQQQYWFWEISS